MSSFLYDELDTIDKYGAIESKNYPFVVDNLNPKLELREYQKKAFDYFYFYNEGDKKPSNNIHLAYNMATGSGKTVIMSGLILYLYHQGYRDFLFFVNRGQILEKTKDNFINPHSNKYLFDSKIVFDNKEVKIKAVDNFSESSSDDINICFTTIQGLFGDIHNQKENALTIGDFRDKKIVLIADEAHHINASTKRKNKTESFLFDGSDNEAKPSWENTVEKIFRSNEDNILLEFSATLELDNKDVKAKYIDKVIFKYDLKDFVHDRYSKKIELLRSDTTKEVRILQALITSLYRQEVANKYSINIKPVVLFKSSKIDESKANQKLFHTLIEELDRENIVALQNSPIEIIKRAFGFFEKQSISIERLIEHIKIAFAPTKVLCTNSDKELEVNQKLLNTLEDNNNSIRAIFTVDKLNEGWDVLNLFDIVRLYEGQSTGGASKGKVGKKTVSEAQLVGRGARYCPFSLNDTQELYKRKYDSDIGNELRVLEELYFHSENESRYISEIKKALRDIGLMEEEENEPIELDMRLKKEFVNTKFYNKKVFINNRKPKNYNYVKKLSDFGIAKSNYEYSLKSGKGALVDVFGEDENQEELNTKRVEKNLVEFCGKFVLDNALLCNDYFSLDNLKKSLPNLISIEEFITKEEYLGQFTIYLNGESKSIEALLNQERLEIALDFLRVLENEMKDNVVEYEGTRQFKPYRFDKIFHNKTMLISKENAKDIYENSDKWFVFEKFYGTSEEEKLIELVGSMIEEIGAKYKKDAIYLIRNERHFKLYSFDEGRAFEPDFVLFLQNNDNNIHYQIFIEPKGEHLKKIDQWKEDFLLSIKDKLNDEVIEYENEAYKVLGLKFYDNANENSFKEQLREEIEV